MRLKGKVALITGGASGIGASITSILAAEGAHVLVNYRSSEDQAKLLKAELEAKGATISLFKADVSVFAEAKALVEKTIETYGNLNIVVLNAGITRDGLLMRMDEEAFDDVIRTDLKGVWNVSRHAMKPLLKSGYGRIITISSVAGILGNAGQTNYSAAKAGVIGLTKALARECASRGVTANAIAPGLIESPMTDGLSADVKQAFKKTIPLNRFGRSEDVAKAVLFLASADAAYITGTTIAVDGGMTMR
jgi:3-oxoacyl-[acyl-carrier protein] reductase